MNLKKPLLSAIFTQSSLVSYDESKIHSKEFNLVLSH